jgi:hypothetical protein
VPPYFLQLSSGVVLIASTANNCKTTMIYFYNYLALQQPFVGFASTAFKPLSSRAMSTAAASAIQIQQDASQNAAAIKIQAVFRGMVDRKLLQSTEPLRRALRTHLFRRHLQLHMEAQSKAHPRFILEGLRSHQPTKQLFDATAVLLNGKRFRPTPKKVYNLRIKESTYKVDTHPTYICQQFNST